MLHRHHGFSNIFRLIALASFVGAAHAAVVCNYSSPTVTCTGGAGTSVTQGSSSFAVVKASSYPVTIAVTGAPGGSSVTGVSITLHGLSADGTNGVTLQGNGMLLVSPGNHYFEMLHAVGGGGSSNITINAVNLSDSNASLAPNQSTTISSNAGTVSWKPTSYGDLQSQSPVNDAGKSGIYPSGAPPNGNVAAANSAASLGTGTFANVFTGDTPNGNWSLYMEDDQLLDNVSFTSWDIAITVSISSTSTSTVLASGTNPSYTATPNNTTLLTATVTGGTGPTGTVTFTDGGNQVTCSQGAQPRPISSGQATCTTSFSTEGDHSLTATYNPDSGFLTSNGGLTQTVIHHSTFASGAYCNPGGISVPGLSNTSPYPSIINVGTDTPSITNALSTLTLTLNGISTSAVGGLSSTHMLLVAPGGAALDFLSDAGGGQTVSAGTNITFSDSASAEVPANFSSTLSGSVSYQPTSYDTSDTFAAPAPVGFSIAAPGGNPAAKTFTTEFNGVSANGNWQLFIYDNNNQTVSVASGWCMNFTASTGIATTTSVNGSPNSTTSGTTVTVTATVKKTSDQSAVTTGTVTFTENGSAVAGGPSSPVSVNSSGQASFTTSTLGEGDHTILATFNDLSNTYSLSFNSYVQRVDNATATPTVSGNTYTYCNTGAIVLPGPNNPSDIGQASPNPSNIFVTNLPGTINALGLDLKGSHFTRTDLTASLLVGPNDTNGATLDFFSNTGNGTAESGNLSFADSAGSLVPTGAISAGTFKPTSYGSANSFISSASGFFTLPGGPYDRAATAGTSTFANVFGSTNGNGTWSLYFNQNIHDTGSGVSSGWCLDFTENAVAVSATKGHSPSSFKQGGSGQFTITVANTGNGSAADPDGNHPLTVTDTLVSGFTAGTPSGTDWSCGVVAQVVTCVNHDTVGSGSDYPVLTIPVTVATNAGTPLTNSATVSGAGTSGTTSNTDSVTIVPSPVLAVAKSHTGNFTQAQTAAWTIQVTNNATSSAGATDGSTVTVSDVLPSGYTLSSGIGTNWICSGTSTVTCTSGAVVAGAGGTFPAITLTVNVPADSPVSVMNTAKVYGGGDVVHTSLGTAAVSNTDTVTVVQVPASIALTSGSGQSAQINQQFTNPLVATVKDAASNPIPNVTVTFTPPVSTSPSITFAGNVNTATTNASGVATSVAITANGHVGGPYNVQAAAGVVTNNFSLTNTSGVAATIALTGGSGQSAQINQPFTNALTATVTDAGNNPVANVTVTFTPPAQTGASITFAGNVNTATTNASGVATSAAITANSHAGGPYNVVATSGAATANFSLTNTAGAAASIALTGGSGQSAQINQQFTNALTATVTDAGNNPVANVTVTFTPPAQTGASITFAGNVNTATTNASGVATSAAITANSHAGGPYNVVATSGAATANFSLTNTAGAASSIALTGGSGQSAQINQPFTNALTATVTDAGNNPVANVTVTFTPPASTSASITFAGNVNTATTNASGVATSAAITANSHAGGPYNVVATSGAATANFSLTNTAGAASSIALTGGSGQSAQINQPFTNALTATVTDAGNNPVPNVTVTFTPPAQTGASITFAGNVNTATTNASGVATSAAITANSHAGGPYNVVATSGAATANFSLTNTAGAAASIALTGGSGQSAQINQQFTNALTATVTDAGNNPVPNVTVTFTPPAQTGASITFAGNVNTATTNASGVATSAAITANGHAGGPYNVVATSGAATNNFALTNTPGTAANIALTGGSGQSAQINKQFTNALTATVTDAGNNPVPNVTVTFTPPAQTGASITFAGNVNTATTNASGVATSAAITANSHAGGPYNVVATSGAATANFSLTNTAGAAASIALTGGSGQSAQINQQFTNALTATVTDAGNNPVPNVTVTFTPPAQTGASITFAGNVNTATTNASGVATSAAITANGHAGGPYNVVATSGAATNNFALTNTPGTAANIALTGGSGQSAQINKQFTNALTATVTDAGNNPVANVTVTFTPPASTSASITFAGNVNTATTNASGVATSAAITANSHAGGPYNVVATSGAATANFSLTNTAGAASSIALTGGSGQSAQINQPFTNALTATVTDAGNNPVANVTVTFTPPASTSASITFAGNVNTATTNASGVATSAAITANGHAGGPYNVVATSGAATANFSLTNTVGAAASIALTGGSGQSAQVNQPFTNALTATVTDAGNNPVANVTVTFTPPASTLPSITFAGNVNTATTNASGVATSAAITANSHAGGPYNVVATSGAATANFSLTNTAGAASSIALTGGSGQSAQINQPFTNALTATVTDAGNNPVPNVTVTFTPPAQTGASITFAGNVNTATTNASGVATSAAITANSHAGGPYNVVATSGAATANFSLTNTAGAAASIALTGGSGQSAQINQQFTNALTATVTDAGNNPVPNVTVTFTPPAQTGASITFAGNVNTATTNASGVATSAAITANGHAGGPYNVVATSGAATANFSLTNTAGAAASIALTGGSGQSAQVNQPFTNALTATVTDAGNNPVPNVTVTFTPPAQTGASITFAGNVNTATTNASGVATSAAITANGHAGGPYNVVATSGAATNNFALTNTPGTAANIALTGGSGQSAQINQQFTNALTATVTDAGNNPVPNVTVTFTSPVSTSPSITFAGNVNTATTNASGVATSAAITANGHAGGPYNVVATSGAATANFSLTNTAGAAASIALTGGSGQSAQINQQFTNALTATVTDAGNNPVPNVTVTFTPPAGTSASITFAGNVNTATTNASGVATSAAITANSHAGGPYNVVATSGAATANFSLTNTAGAAASIALTGGSGQSAQINQPFTNALTATVTDAGSNPVPNVTVTFTPPVSTSPSITFAGSVNTATTNASGVATSAAITANSHAGGPYNVLASSGAATNNFALTNTPGTAANIALTGGSGQSALINTQFTQPLTVAVTDAGNNPVVNVTVTFTPPAGTLPSATFSGGLNTALTNGAGVATSATLTANGHAGGPYSVQVSAGAAVNNFMLTNTPGAASTTLSVSSSPNPSASGQAVLITATITASGSGETGSISFFDGNTLLGAANVISPGFATFQTSSLTVGSHTLSANYSGDANFLASTGKTTQTVNGSASTTALVSAPNPSTFGQTVTLTATVTGGGSSPTGSVTFLDGMTTLGSGPVGTNGTASIQTAALAAGAHSLTAAYSGDANYSGSTSKAITQTVNQLTTSTALSVSPNPAVPGQPVTLTATVTPSTATGTVTFLNGGTPIGSQVLTAGSASISLSIMSNGALTASYGGDLNDAPSLSPPVSESVSGGSTPNPVSVSPASGSGLSQTMTFTFNDPSGWQDLDVVDMLINNFLDGRQACYLAYSRTAGVLYLVGDDGGTLSAGLALGGAGSVSNSQCAVAAAGSSVTGSGNTLTVTLAITFNAAFGGDKVVYLAARNLAGGNSGWQAFGVWQVPFTPAGTISVVSLNPARGATGSGTPQTFTLTVTDSNGAGDIGIVDVLINNFLDGRQACYLAYVGSSNSLLLVNDAGSAGGPFAGGMVLNGAGTAIQNSQCSIGGSSTAVLAGNTLTLTLNITFTGAFVGNQIVYAAGRDMAGGNNTGWDAVGTETVVFGEGSQ